MPNPLSDPMVVLELLSIALTLFYIWKLITSDVAPYRNQDLKSKDLGKLCMGAVDKLIFVPKRSLEQNRALNRLQFERA